MFPIETICYRLAYHGIAWLAAWISRYSWLVNAKLFTNSTPVVPLRHACLCRVELSILNDGATSSCEWRVVAWTIGIDWSSITVDMVDKWVRSAKDIYGTRFLRLCTNKSQKLRSAGSSCLLILLTNCWPIGKSIQICYNNSPVVATSVNSSHESYPSRGNALHVLMTSIFRCVCA